MKSKGLCGRFLLGRILGLLILLLIVRGDFLSAAKLLERYGKLGKLELARENAELTRAYLMNFKEGKKRVPYAAAAANSC